MNKMLVILVAGILIVGGIAVFVLMPGEDNGELSVTGEVEIHIEPANGDGEASANMSINEASWSEMAMMEFGSGIRTAEFTTSPDFSETVNGLDKNAEYNIWATARIHVTGGEDIDSLYDDTSSSQAQQNLVKFEGQTGGEIGADMPMTTATGLKSVNFLGKSYLALNSDSVINQADKGKFTHYEQAGSSVHILGQHIDGMQIKCTVVAVAQSSDGTVYADSTSAVLELHVDNWADVSLRVSITSMGTGSDQFSIVNALDFASSLEEMRIASIQ